MLDSRVKALVPTAVAAALLTQEFPDATMETDGTLTTVIIFGIGYSDAVTRIREWMTRTHVGPVLVSDGETAEELLTAVEPRGARLRSPGAAASLSMRAR